MLEMYHALIVIYMLLPSLMQNHPHTHLPFLVYAHFHLHALTITYTHLPSLTFSYHHLHALPFIYMTHLH